MCVANSPSKNHFTMVELFVVVFLLVVRVLKAEPSQAKPPLSPSKGFGSVVCLVFVLVKNTGASTLMQKNTLTYIDGKCWRVHRWEFDAYRIGKLQWLLLACQGFDQVDRTPRYPPAIAVHHSSRYAQLRRGRWSCMSDADGDRRRSQVSSTVAFARTHRSTTWY